ncbi:YcaO-like family protein [Jatrophihabitans sp. YIM 134969]
MDDVARAYRSALSGGRLREFSLTDYDRTGIPVVATVWDDGRSDAHGVGYGSTEQAATIGALGELAERVVLAPVVRGLPRRRASHRDLVDDLGADHVADPLTLVLPAGSDYAPTAPLDWVPTTRWRTGEQVWVPVEFVASDPVGVPDRPLVTPITNGLGAGDTADRAVGHGLLELLQRDGDTVSFRALDQGVVVDVDASTDPETRALVEGFRARGIEPVVKLAATEFVPVVYCTGDDTDPDAPPMALGAVGEAAHPDRDVAIRKALLEFASSRARRVFAFGPLETTRSLHPDYLAEELQRPLGEQEPRALAAMREWAGWDATTTRRALEPVFGKRVTTVDPRSLPSAPPLDPSALLTDLLDRLADFDVLVVVSPEGGPGNIRAAKVIAPGLEVETMSYLRIGERVATRLLERGDDLVGRGEPDRPGRLPVRLTAAATERLGGPVWLDADAVERVVGPLYPLYREPRRHAVQRTTGPVNSLDALRRSQDRDFGQEGIPMVLALVDETGEWETPDPGGVPSPDDAALVATLDRLRADLLPTRRDDDLGVTATLLATAGWLDDQQEDA